MMTRDKKLARPFLSSLCALRRCEAGLAAIEFAMIVPVMLLIGVGVIDLGGLLYTSYRLDSAVAAGTQYAADNAASVSSTNGAALAKSVATVVESSVSSAWANDTVNVNNGPYSTVTAGTFTGGGTASNANSCFCPTGTPPNWTWGSAATCGSSCPSGGIAGKFISIAASVTYTPLLTTFGFIKNNTLTQNSMVQVQ